MIFEVCASSFESAKNAQKAGAHRIELCSELGVGGITPSYGLIKKVMEELSILNCVLIRPRSGDFTYTDDEFDVMLRDVQFCRQMGCHAVVSGVLHPDLTVDVDRTKKLIDACGDMDFVFHRAFDCVVNPEQELEKLKAIGVKRILSSGGCKSAIQGLDNLIKFREISKGNPEIMPGGGINKQSLPIIREAGFDQVHFSATVFQKALSVLPFTMKTEAFLDENIRCISSETLIKELIEG